eukprot:1844715-Amphidinium_carterae.8
MLGLLKSHYNAEMSALQATHLARWKQQMQRMGPACDFVRGTFVNHWPTVVDEQGKLHIGDAEKSKALCDYWQSVCKPPQGHSKATVTEFVKRRLQQFEIGEQFGIDPF